MRRVYVWVGKVVALLAAAVIVLAFWVYNDWKDARRDAVCPALGLTRAVMNANVKMRLPAANHCEQDADCTYWGSGGACGKKYLVHRDEVSDLDILNLTCGSFVPISLWERMSMRIFGFNARAPLGEPPSSCLVSREPDIQCISNKCVNVANGS